jgi:sarcosine oxidase, subunit beta
MNRTNDVIIIGAGIIGCAIAFEMAKAGWRPVVLDRLPAAGYGSTSSSSAIIRSTYSTFAGSALAWEATSIWKDWADYTEAADERGAAEYRKTGCLLIDAEGNEFIEKIRSIMAKVGIPFEEWDESRLTGEMPSLDVHRFGPPAKPDDPGFAEPDGRTIKNAIYFPESGYVNDPQLAAHNLQKAAESYGAVFRFNTDVRQILQKDNRVAGVALVDDTTLSAGVVINVGGPHSSQINRLAGVDEAMSVGHRPLRKEVCYLPPPSNESSPTGNTIILDLDVGGYCRPETGGKLVVGSTEPACDTLNWVDDPDNYNSEFSDQWMVQAMRMAMRMPDIGIPGQASGVVALYDASDDWVPIYDRSDLPGYYMACATSGNQFKNAPVAGALMTTLIDACEAGHDHDASPVQFPLKRTGHMLDLGNFSRNRPIHQDSSFTVLG